MAASARKSGHPEGIAIAGIFNALTRQSTEGFATPS